MKTLEQQFNSRVSEFLSRTGMRPTILGMKAVGDPNLMREIAEGRSPSLRTADQVLGFINHHEGDSGGARAPPRRRRLREPSSRSRRMNEPIRFLRLPEVEARTGLARPTIYVRMAEGSFPKSVSLSGRAVGWIEAEIDEWVRERIVDSRGDGETVATDPSGKGRR